MKAFFAALLALLVHTTAVADIPKELVEMRLRKAHEILTQVGIVTTNAIGYAGDCPEANWALSVIAAYDPKPIERLLEIAEESTVEGALMCFAGIKAIDSKTFEGHLPEWRKEAEESSVKLQLQEGCIITEVLVADALMRIAEWNQKITLRAKIPLLEQTIRPRKTDIDSILKHAISIPMKEDELPSIPTSAK